MYAELIRKHFTQCLGSDVGVSFRDPDTLREVVLYRPDKLTDPFVTWAFEQLANTEPGVAARIDRLIVSYQTRLGPSQRGVDIPPITPDRSTFRRDRITELTFRTTS